MGAATHDAGDHRQRSSHAALSTRRRFDGRASNRRTRQLQGHLVHRGGVQAAWPQAGRRQRHLFPGIALEHRELRQREGDAQCWRFAAEDEGRLDAAGAERRQRCGAEGGPAERPDGLRRSSGRDSGRARSGPIPREGRRFCGCAPRQSRHRHTVGIVFRGARLAQSAGRIGGTCPGGGKRCRGRCESAASRRPWRRWRWGARRARRNGWRRRCPSRWRHGNGAVANWAWNEPRGATRWYSDCDNFARSRSKYLRQAAGPAHGRVDRSANQCQLELRGAPDANACAQRDCHPDRIRSGARVAVRARGGAQ